MGAHNKIGGCRKIPGIIDYIRVDFSVDASLGVYTPAVVEKTTCEIRVTGLGLHGIDRRYRS